MRLAALLAVLVAAPAAAADPPKATDFEGVYACQGEGERGNRYAGTVDITKKGDSYTVTWTLTSGERYVGVGVPAGDTLSVAWLSRGAVGVMAYTAGKGGRLTGRWSPLGGDGTVFKETLTKKLS